MMFRKGMAIFKLSQPFRLQLVIPGPNEDITPLPYIDIS